MALFKLLGTLGLRFQCLDKVGQRRVERVERFVKRLANARVGVDLPQRKAGVLPAESQAQIAGSPFERCPKRDPVHRIARVRQPFGHGITGQLEQLARRQRFAEEQRRRLGQLVRFVEDHCVGGGQQFGHAGIAQHNVGKEQVMVDDHKVGLLRLLAGAHHEAFLVVRTFAAQAVVPCGRHELPHWRVLGYFGQLGLVPGRRGLGESADLAQPGRILLRRQPAVGLCPLQVIVANVVGPPLEQGDRDRHVQRMAYRRNVAEVKLVLQVLGTGRKDDLPAPEHGRHQIGVRLARTRASLDDHRVVVGDRIGHGLGHLLLRRARPVAGDRTGQRAGFGKDRSELRRP